VSSPSSITPRNLDAGILSSSMTRQTVNRTAATTRSVVGRSPAPARLLEPGQVVVSPETRLELRVERLLGRGGFGEVYLTERLGRSSSVPEVVCIKASDRMDGWLREAYFGQLL